LLCALSLESVLGNGLIVINCQIVGKPEIEPFDRDWRYIAIALKTHILGEQMAQDCENALIATVAFRSLPIWLSKSLLQNLSDSISRKLVSELHG